MHLRSNVIDQNARAELFLLSVFLFCSVPGIVVGTGHPTHIYFCPRGTYILVGLADVKQMPSKI